MVGVAPKDFIVASATVMCLWAGSIYWTSSKTRGKYESFTHLNLKTWGLDLNILDFPLKHESALVWGVTQKHETNRHSSYQTNTKNSIHIV